MTLVHSRLFSFVLLLCLLLTSLQPAAGQTPTATPPDHALLTNEQFASAYLTAVDIQAILDRYPGILKQLQVKMGREQVASAQAIFASSVGRNFNVDPTVLLVFLEVRSQLLTDAHPDDATLQHPLGLSQAGEGLFNELALIVSTMEQAYWQFETTADRHLVLSDGTPLGLSNAPNAGSFAVQTALATIARSVDEYQQFADPQGEFYTLYDQLLTNQTRPPHPSAGAATAPFLYKPFAGDHAAGSFFDHDPRGGFFQRFDGRRDFGYDWHVGTDYPMSPTPVRAAADGVVDVVYINVTEAGYQSWCGGNPYSPVTALLIRHTINGASYRTMYWHLTAGAIATNPRTGRMFKVNDTVVRGDVIGTSGSTGCSTGPHLHFEVRRGGTSSAFSVDPYGWCGTGADPWPSPNEVLWAERMTNPSPCGSSVPPPSSTPINYTDFNRDGTPDIYTIDRKGGGTNSTEVHILSGATHHQTWLLETGTSLGQTGVASDWAYLVGDYNQDTIPDLYAIKKQGASSTEVHILDGSKSYKGWLLHTSTPQHVTGNTGEWVFALGDYNGDGRPDLFTIDKQGTGTNSTEVHVLDGASKYQNWLLHTGTGLGMTGFTAQWAFDVADYNGDGKPDLYAIKREGPTSTEVHILNGADTYHTYLLETNTALHHTGIANDWGFTVADYNKDGKPDIYAIKKNGATSTETHILSGATRYQSWLAQTGTLQHKTGDTCEWDFATGGDCVTNIPPRTPTLVSPANNSTVSARALTLKWNDAGDPDQQPRATRDYIAEIRQVGGSWNKTSGWRTPAGWAMTVPADATYEWRVRSGDGIGASPWSAWWRVKVATPPPVVAPTAVAINGPTSGTLSTTVTLTATARPTNVTTPLTVRWQATGQTPVTHTTNSLTDRVPWTWTTPGIKTIRVSVQNSAGVVTTTHTLTVAPPTKPIILNAEAGLDNVALRWNASNLPRVQAYRVYRSTAVSATTLLTTTSQVTFVDAAALVDGNQYCYTITAIDAAGSILQTSNVACAIPGRLSLWMPHTWARPGDVTTVAVNIRNANHLAIAASDLWIDVDSTVLEPQTISRTALTETYSWVYATEQLSGTTRLRIAAISTAAHPLTGSGSLFWLTFRVRGTEGQTTPLDLREFITGVGGSTIYTPADLISPVPLVLQDGSLRVSNAVSDTFMLGDLNGNGVVEAVDAYIVLRIASGQLSPTPAQQQAGDANGNGVVDAADASMILYYAAHGSWPLPGAAGVHRASAASTSIPRLEVDAMTATTGTTTTVYLRASDLTDWAGGEFVLTYDPGVITLLTAQPVGPAAAALLALHDDGAGVLHLALAHDSALAGDGALIALTFDVSASALPSTSTLAIVEAHVNDSAGRDFATSALQRPIQRGNGRLTVHGSVHHLYLPLVQQ